MRRFNGECDNSGYSNVDDDDQEEEEEEDGGDIEQDDNADIHLANQYKAILLTPHNFKQLMQYCLSA